MKLLNLFFISYLFVGCTVRGTSANTTKKPQIIKQSEGFVVDVNKDESLILYEVPKDLTSEYSEVKLMCHLIASNSDIQLSDSVKLNENLHARFFNDTIVIVPTNKDIWLYNLKQKKYFDKLTNLQSGEYIVAFNIAQDKQKIAFIVLSSTEAKFKTFCMDLITNSISNIEHSINSEDDEEYFCSVYIINSHIVFSLNNNLYDLKNGANEDTLITKQLSFNAYGRYLFAVDSNNVVYIEGYDYKTSIKSYDLRNSSVTQLSLSIDVPSKYNAKNITLGTIFYNNQYLIQLLYDIPYLYLNNDFFKQQNYISFKGTKIVIKRDIDKDKEKENFSILKIE